jgi:hypothetical protein
MRSLSQSDIWMYNEDVTFLDSLPTCLEVELVEHADNSQATRELIKLFFSVPKESSLKE